MRAAFGRVNTLHNHLLPWTDRPLVTQNLVRGEDGINDAGFALSRIIPAPKGIFLRSSRRSLGLRGGFPFGNPPGATDGRSGAMPSERMTGGESRPI